jgi:hypothetical protein
MEFLKVDEKCYGCDKVTKDETCEAYINPSIWWREGWNCPLATHVKKSITEEEVRKRVGQQKQKKGK